jgi:gamma-glutamylcyclotransferase (GGCT)/AIG2-like uncharacterized protein YtfP
MSLATTEFAPTMAPSPIRTPVCPVTLDDYELTFSGGGVATIVPAEGKQVPGLLWELTPECERALDHYEGFPSYYDKQEIVVKAADNTGYRVMAYVMTPQFSRDAVVPSEFYYNGIRDGYIQNGMDTTPLEKALRKTKREAERFQGDFFPWYNEKPAANRTKKPNKSGRHER